ncbi:MAG: hypothetical protein K1X64_18665 [Myxococcaceae bacterium]|nr:hypothetical protein [Myxococcaceae bacterium]
MSPVLVSWVASVFGAALFFAAGFFAFRRSAATRHSQAQQAHQKLSATLEDTVEQVHQRDQASRALTSQLEKLRQENATLKAAADMERLKQSTALTAREVQVTLGPSRRLKGVASLVDAPVVLNGRELQSLVERIAREGGVLSAVIADDMGLLVASAGAHAEALGALGAFMGPVSQKAQQLLPIHDVVEVVLHDEQQSRITLRRLKTAQTDLVLALMTDGAQGVPVNELMQRASVTKP